jgi:two-component system OmpR family sensor kinase
MPTVAPDGRRLWLTYRLAPRGLLPMRGLHVPPEMLVLGIVGGLAFSAVLAWYLTSPIRSLREGFGALASGDLAARVGPRMGRRRDEIADLAQDFDRMAQRLQELVLMRDRLLHDVSHELRSPLARLTLAIGLAGYRPPAPTPHSTVSSTKQADWTCWWASCCNWPGLNTSKLRAKTISTWPI